LIRADATLLDAYEPGPEGLVSSTGVSLRIGRRHVTEVVVTSTTRFPGVLVSSAARVHFVESGNPVFLSVLDLVIMGDY